MNYYNLRDDIKPEEVIMYLRKSRADDPLLSVEEVLSKHETRLDEWVEHNFPSPIPPENRYKEVASGESVSDRPEFKKILKLVESPNIKAILVVEISRLGRPDTAEIGLISKIFRYTNTLVITPERTFNVSDEFEREMFESELKRGNFYLEYSKKLLRNGREVSIKSGNFIGSKPIYGYDKAFIVEGKRKCPTLVINEEQAEVVRKIFNDYVNENIGVNIIANRLNDLGIKSATGQMWMGDGVRSILRNVHYIGKVRWNRRKTVYVVNDGEFRKTRPVASDDDILICDGKHEAIISEELFYAASEKSKKSHRTVENKELRNPFASLLYCQCGKALSYKHYAKRQEEPRLVCNGQKFCGSTSCSVDEIMNYLVVILREKISEFETIIENLDTDSTSFHEKHLQSLEKKLADLNSKEVALWESQLDVENRMPSNVFQALTVKLAKEREEIEIAIEKTRSAILTPTIYETQLVTLEKALSALLDPNVSVADKNHFLKACIERIEYKRGKAVRLKGSGVGRGWATPPIELEVRLKV